MKKISFENKNAKFYNTLKSRVREYFAEHKISPHANAQMIIKTIIIAVIFVGLYVALTFFQLPIYVVLPLCAAMGLTISAIGFNIMHDAAHRSYSSKGWINNLLSYSLDMVGGSVTIWKTKHNVVHHTFTNVPHWDGDIAQNLVLRLAPAQKLRKAHRFQHIYAFGLYSLLSLVWVFWGDYRNLITRKIENYEMPKLKPKEMFLLLFFKAFHIFYALVLPSFFHPWWAVLLFYIAIHLVMGFVLSIVFQLAHVYEGTSYPEPNPETNKIENEWAKHQLETTANFDIKNKILNWFVGGLNFQVEHHLFPNICHVHYPALNKILRETCKEFSMPYHEFPTFFSAIKAHYKQLYALGHHENSLA